MKKEAKKPEAKKPEVKKPALTDAERAAELVAKMAALVSKKDTCEERKQLAKQVDDLATKLMIQQQDCEVTIEAATRKIENLRSLRQALVDATSAVRNIIQNQLTTKGAAV